MLENLHRKVQLQSYWLFAILLILIFCVHMPSFAVFDEFYDQMDYLSQRDRILSKNIANADTPNYRPTDISKRRVNTKIVMHFSNPNHIEILDTGEDFELYKSRISDIKPNGNAVNLEEEIMKKTENSMRLQETINVYNKTRAMLRTATVGMGGR